MKIKTFIINLEKDVHKRIRLEQQLQIIDTLDYTFIKAIDGKELTSDEIESNIDIPRFEERNNRSFTLPEIGCAMSHRFVYRTMIENNLPVSLILEDDTVLYNDFMPIICELSDRIKNISSPSVMLLSPYFMYYLSDKVSTVSTDYNIYALKNGVMAAAYLINESAARLLSSLSDRIYYFADDWTLFRKHGINVYGCVPHLVSIDNSLSEIGKSVDQIRKKETVSLFSKIKSILIFQLKKFFGRRFSEKIW